MASGGILFLDLAKAASGYAYGVSISEPPETGVWKCEPEWSYGRIWAALDNELARAIKRFQPAKVGIEAPLPARGQTTAHTARLALGLCATAEQTCYRFTLDPLVVRCDTVRQNVCGRSRIDDEEGRSGLTAKSGIVAPWIRSMGWSIGDHNAADAAVGLAYMLGYRHRRQALRRAA